MSSKVTGSLKIANEVIADIAGYTALESYGVVGMAAPTLENGIATLLPNTKLRKGVEVSATNVGVRVDLYIIVEHGTGIAQVSRNLADRVRFILSDLTEVPIDTVEIHIQGIKVRAE